MIYLGLRTIYTLKNKIASKNANIAASNTTGCARRCAC